MVGALYPNTILILHLSTHPFNQDLFNTYYMPNNAAKKCAVSKCAFFLKKKGGNYNKNKDA